MRLIIRSLCYDDDFTILGGSMSSRLFKKFVKKRMGLFSLCLRRFISMLACLQFMGINSTVIADIVNYF